MTNKELKERLSKINEEWEKEKELFCEKMKQNFKEAIKILFENEPDLKKIVFRGWVPSFNDGDPCEFMTDIEDAHVIERLIN